MITRKHYLLFLFSLLLFVSCKKADTLSTAEKNDNRSIEDRFFESNRTTDHTEKIFVDFLKRVNYKEHFVEATVQRIGYPRWDKAFTGRKDFTVTSFQANLEGDSTETYYIPFVKDSQNYVDAAMIIKVSQADTTFSYRLACSISDLTNTTNSISDEAELFAVFFMVMDKRVFGYEKFIPTNPDLFKVDGHIAKEVKLNVALANPFSSNLFAYIEYCQDVSVSWNDCPYAVCAGPNGTCDGCPQCTSSMSYTYCWGEWIETGGGGGGSGGSSGGSGSGGSGGTSGGSSTPLIPVVEAAALRQCHLNHLHHPQIRVAMQPLQRLQSPLWLKTAFMQGLRPLSWQLTKQSKIRSHSERMRVEIIRHPRLPHAQALQHAL